MLRTLLENRLRSLKVVRRLPREYGGARIVATPSAGLRYMFKRSRDLDPHLLSLCRDYVQSASVVWDIGANVGLFSDCAAYYCGPSGQVFAIEADSWLSCLLRESALRANPETHGKVTVVPVGIASSNGLRTFCIANRSRAANFLKGYGTTQTGGVREEHLVPAVTLDWLMQHIPAPHVVKIDIEGAELEALSGAKELLSLQRPIVLLEVSRTEEVTALLRSYRYRLFDGDKPAAERAPLQSAPWSTVAIPEEHT